MKSRQRESVGYAVVASLMMERFASVIRVSVNCAKLTFLKGE